MKMLATPSPQAEIAMTPLIDMMFLLIIFFLVSTAFVDPEKDLQVNLAEVTDGEPTKSRTTDINVNVRQEGTLVVDGHVTDIDILTEKLTQARKKNPNQLVRVRGDKEALHKYVVKVLEACDKADVTNIAIATRVEP